MAEKLPGKGLMGWLGRQVGYVNKAAKTKPPASRTPEKKPRPTAAPQAAPQEPPQVIYREGKVEEAEHPTQPGLKLRRTIIDEVIANPSPANQESRGQSHE